MNDGAPSNPKLDAIAREAAAIDAGAAAPGSDAPPGPDAGAAAPQPEKISTEAQLDGLLKMAIDQAARKFPSVGPVWSDEKRAMFCGALGPLLDKYDVVPFAFFERWRVEIMATVICVPLLYATALAIRADLDRVAAAAAKDVSPGAESVAGGEGFKPSAGVNADGVPKS